MKKLVHVFLATMFLLVSVSCTNQYKEVVSTITQYTYQIEYSFTLLSNDSVGDDWQTSVMHNGHPIQSGDLVTLSPNTDIVLYGEVIEQDAFPDVGNATVILEPDAHASTETEITVIETHGTYIGNTATWRLHCSITRVD